MKIRPFLNYFEVFLFFSLFPAAYIVDIYIYIYIYNQIGKYISLIDKSSTTTTQAIN
jgi:hypothetical protein